MHTSQFISSVKPSAVAKKAIAEAQARIANLMGIVVATEPDAGGRISALHLAADAAEQVFYASPTIANAEIFHDTLVRSRDAEISFERINRAIHRLFPACHEAAQPAAFEILDLAIAALDAEAATAKANVAKSATVFSDIGSIELEHVAARAGLESHRSEIARDALGWLATFGHL